MNTRQNELLATLLITVCGGAGWSFLLCKLHQAMVLPMLG